MPFVDLMTSSGPFSFHYTISTPLSSSSAHPVPGLPCLLFLHGGCIAQEVFEFQFNDRRLRQFNLLALDMRGYGETRGTIGNTDFTPYQSAHDVERFMASLNLPACHIFGLSVGCCVALELAARAPERVRSLTLCSPLSPAELPEIASGRLELYRCWALGVGLTGTDAGDEEMLEDSLAATAQILHNHLRTDALQAMAARGAAVAKNIWAGSLAKLAQAWKANVEWYICRRAVPPSLLQKVACPVNIIHCADDIAYSLQVAEDLARSLKDAGIVQVALHDIPGAHYGNITNPSAMNTILYDTVLSRHLDFTPDASLASQVSPSSKKILTPWTHALMQHGYDPDDEDDLEVIPNVALSGHPLSHVSVY